MDAPIFKAKPGTTQRVALKDLDPFFRAYVLADYKKLGRPIPETILIAEIEDCKERIAREKEFKKVHAARKKKLREQQEAEAEKQRLIRHEQRLKDNKVAAAKKAFDKLTRTQEMPGLYEQAAIKKAARAKSFSEWRQKQEQKECNEYRKHHKVPEGATLTYNFKIQRVIISVSKQLVGTVENGKLEAVL